MNAVLLGALLHDLGKVGQRAGLSGNSSEIFSAHLNSLLPPCLEDAGKLASMMETSTALNTQEKDSVRIIQLADWISAGQKYEQEKEASVSPLLGLFCRVDIKKGTLPESAFYSPQSLRIDRNVIFPDNGIDEIRKIYNGTWNSLLKDLALARQIKDADAYATTLFYLLKKHTWAMPFTTSQMPSDVSLFDHSRIASALAACLMKEAASADEISSELLGTAQGKERFLLAAGDVSGIQDFLYTITSKGAAKGLRGRSLYLQLLSEATARFMLRELDYPLANLIYSGGGHFYLLISSSDEKRLQDLKLTLERALLKMHQGDIFLALGWSEMTVHDLLDDGQTQTQTAAASADAEQKKQKKDGKGSSQSQQLPQLQQSQQPAQPQQPQSRLAAKWSEAMNCAGAAKLQRFSSLASEAYEEIFGLNPNEKAGRTPICDVCKREGDLWYRAEGGWYRWYPPNPEKAFCGYCKTFEKMGERLAKAEYLIEARRGCSDDDEIQEKHLLCSFDPFGIEYYCCPDKKSLEALAKKRHNSKLTIYSLDPESFIDESLAKIASENNAALGFRLIARSTPKKENVPPNEKDSIADLSELAERCRGVPRIGVLRMDVDDLGLIFSAGLKEKASLSRVSTLSTMISIFFDGWIDKLCQEPEWTDKVYLIYSGGDDLFIIGSWNVIPEIAIRIREDFRAYTCNNPNFTLSGGISIADEKYPLYRSAESAKQALDDAKSQERDKAKKDSITFLKETMDWTEMGISFEIADLLKTCLNDGKPVEGITGNKKLPRSVLWNLYAAWDLYWKNRDLLDKNKTLTLKDIELLALYDRWRWRLVYFLDRAGGRNRAFEGDLSRLKTAILRNEWNGAASGRGLIEYLGVPVRWAELLTRRARAEDRKMPEKGTQKILAPER